MLKPCLLASCSMLAFSAAMSRVEAAPAIFGYTGAQQTWTVPATDAYTIVATGARGGDEIYSIDPSSYGGEGVQVTATFNLTVGEMLTLVVGGRGGNGPGTGLFGGGGGGGGSFVFGPGFSPLLVAGGGGGGSGGCCQNGGNGVESTSGGPGRPGYGGKTVPGGTNGLGGAAYLGGGGAGVRGGGGTGVCLRGSCTVPRGGRSSGDEFAGGAGGYLGGDDGGRGGAGGFGGGGGGGGGTAGGGGGGGYSGGGGGTVGGGGGGSFIANSGRGVYFNYSSARDGSVSISTIEGTSEPVPEPGSFAMFSTGALGLLLASRRRPRCS